jgi:hypothetical protein
MSGISKTVITITVLHPSDEPLSGSLACVLEEMDDGNAVGLETFRTTVAVADDAVKNELLALGNDGEFFEVEDYWHGVENG